MIESHQYANNNTESKTPDEEKVNEWFYIYGKKRFPG
jgi:hypothetical protein